MSSDNMGSLILTSSQELDLLNDDEVDSMMHLLGSQLNQEQAHHYNVVYEQEPYQIVEDQKNFHLQTFNEEETCQNGVMQYPGTAPSLTPIPPAVISNEEYSGPYNFEVYIDPHQATKNPWVYSAVLNKLFITMSNPFPIDFKWEPQVVNLYVRATPLYSLAQHVQELVSRCIPHSLPSDASNGSIREDILGHILRCQARNAQYYGNADKNIHYNVVVPLGTPQIGTETVRLMFTFVCKNSCPSGMNRKPLEVVFTLEDEAGNVYGRKKISVRVCSCPKRDKDKEEKDFVKDKTTSGPLPAGKKRKLVDKNENKPPSLLEAPLDTKKYLLQVEVCGKHNRALGMKLLYDLMAGELLRNGPNEHLQKCVNKIREQMKQLD